MSIYGFQDYTDWWMASFEWNTEPRRMADYVKRTLFLRFFTQEQIDFLFDLAKKHPAVVDQMDAGVFDYTSELMNYFLSLPGIPEDLQERMKMIQEADMAKIATVISKRQD